MTFKKLHILSSMAQKLAVQSKDCRSGSVSVIFAIFLIALMGAVGVAVDYSMWRNQQTKLQDAADSSSLAAATAYSMLLVAGDKSAADKAKQVALSHFQNRVGTAYTPTVNVDKSTNEVTVQAATTERRYFSALASKGDVNIAIKSKARVKNATIRACIVALDPNSAVGIDFGLSGTMTAHKCAIWSNSTSTSSINANGSGTVSAAKTCAAGGIAKVGIDFSPAAEQDCPPVSDPLESWAPPTKPVTCQHSNLAYDAADGSNIVYLDPGVHCGGMKINGNMRVILNPGLHIFTDGAVVASGGASIEGTDVSLWFTGPGSYLDLGGSSEVKLSAPTSGDWAGMLIVSGRDQLRETYRIKGNTSLFLQGSIYLPTHHLIFSGGPDAIVPPDFTVLVAATIEFGGSSVLELRGDIEASDMPAYSAQGVGTAFGTVLVE
jgi:Putative Flp pilus-assembly TadE/G-like